MSVTEEEPDIAPVVEPSQTQTIIREPKSYNDMRSCFCIECFVNCGACVTACAGVLLTPCTNGHKRSTDIKNYIEPIIVRKPKAKSKKKKKNNESTSFVTGYLQRPTRKFPDLTLAACRKASSAILVKQNFGKHTLVEESGELITTACHVHTDNSETTSDDGSNDDESTEEQILAAVIYVLQMRLEEEINVPNTPIDGYDEALMESTHKDDQTYLMMRRKSSVHAKLTLSAVPSRLTNVGNIRNSRASILPRINPRTLCHLTTPMFLAMLPTFSIELKEELIGNMDEDLHHIKELENRFCESGNNKKKSYTAERWLAVLYIDYKAMKGIAAFRRLLARFILHTYLICFEERDLAKQSVTTEFRRRIDWEEGMDVEIPYTFTDGIAIGGPSILYALHRNGAMDKIFKSSIMDPDMYRTWLRNPQVAVAKREVLVLKVPLSHFQLVQKVMNGKIGNLDRSSFLQEEERFLLDASWVVNRAQRLWNETLQHNKYSEPKLLIYVVLNNTIWNVLNMMEGRLRKSKIGGGHRIRMRDICCCAGCCPKHVTIGLGGNSKPLKK